MATYFSEPNHGKYLVPFRTLLNPFISSNLIRNGFKLIKVLFEMSYIKIFPYDFSSSKILLRSKSSVLINKF